ncbi:hypothetical protein BDN71DRAFT_1507607 [Pleurotus eryngii]|uniref:Uncharacterized protein n=1 Tax=Pleurotus eryngii TaxID=5323 RepID=A0A9P6D6C4_PLEER|nr:hypothetical protein BDN71DRAFT_1507607 [Pleurotus eryngii]
MQYHLPVAFLALIVAVVSSQPSNDWNQPYFDGECPYDLQDGGDTSRSFGAQADLTADLEALLRVNVQLILLDISMNLDVGIGYQIDLQLWLPASTGHFATKSITRKASPLTVSASPGTIKGHAIQLRLSGLAGQINAAALSEVDAFAKLQLNTQAVTAASKGRRGVIVESSNGYMPPYDSQAQTLATRAADLGDIGPFKGYCEIQQASASSVKDPGIFSDSLTSTNKSPSSINSFK